MSDEVKQYVPEFAQEMRELREMVRGADQPRDRDRLCSELAAFHRDVAKLAGDGTILEGTGVSLWPEAVWFGLERFYNEVAQAERDAMRSRPRRTGGWPDLEAVAVGELDDLARGGLDGRRADELVAAARQKVLVLLGASGEDWL